MSNVQETGANIPVTEPQQVLHQEPEAPPPSYESLFLQQLHQCIPVPSSPMEPLLPYPTQVSQNATFHYDPMASRVTIDDRKLFQQPSFNPNYVPAIFDPSADVPPFDDEERCDQSENARNREAKGCSILRFFLLVLAIVAMCGIAVILKQQQIAVA